jgi:mannose-6-phosphate isomerase-like protein (cupin superfamily)
MPPYGGGTVENMKKEWIEVSSYQGEGYLPMIDYGTWRVAILRYCEELEVQNLATMQKHDETDEVFILLEGNCVLFTGGNQNSIGEIDAIAMEPLQLYNVKKGTWHTHTLDHAATVLIVENRDTCDMNSPTNQLTLAQIKELQALYRKL